MFAIPVVPKAKILGIWVATDHLEEASYLWNFKEILCRIRSVCDAWICNLALSLKGKITVANALLISLLQYPCSIIHTPSRVIVEYKKIVSQFLWNCRKPKIAYASITKPISQGGLNLLDLESRIKVTCLQWIRRWVGHPEMSTAVSFSHFLQTENLTSFFRFKNPILNKQPNINRFYSGLLSTWSPLRCFILEREDEVRREPLWLNKAISWNVPPEKRNLGKCWCPSGR